MNDELTDAELQEALLVWSIRDDQIRERGDHQAGRESYGSISRRERLLSAWLREVMRRRVSSVLLRRSAALALLCLLCWPALTGSAPAPAQACDLAVSGVQIRRRVEAQVNGLRVPIGQIETVWSCSTAEAEANATTLEAEVRSRAGVAAAPHAAGLLDWIATVSGK